VHRQYSNNAVHNRNQNNAVAANGVRNQRPAHHDCGSRLGGGGELSAGRRGIGLHRRGRRLLLQQQGLCRLGRGRRVVGTEETEVIQGVHLRSGCRVCPHDVKNHLMTSRPHDDVTRHTATASAEGGA
jgi:hypothetical protein